jgi:hypothetical protein
MFYRVQAYAAQLFLAGVAAAALVCYQGRPRGWVRRDLVEARESPVAGKGLFASAGIARGTVLGCYPGRLRSPAEMAGKVETVPLAGSYAFQTGAAPDQCLHAVVTGCSGTRIDCYGKGRAGDVTCNKAS